MGDGTFRQPEHSQPEFVRGRRLILLLASIIYIMALPFIHSIGSDQGPLHEGVEDFGVLLFLSAIAGRLWWTFQVGGREPRIVASNRWSFGRNSLYAFSLMAILGMGLQTGSLAVALLATGLGYALVHPGVRRNEDALASVFDEDYQAYCIRMFGSNLALWRGMERTIVFPSRLSRTFLEVLTFLLAIPICEAIERAQDGGYLLFLRLP